MFLFSSWHDAFGRALNVASLRCKNLAAIRGQADMPRASRARRLTACENLSVDLRAARQAYRKNRTFARLARHRHVAAHHARELAGDGKAEARAAEALSGRGVGLSELLEQLGLLLRSHADAGVGDGELDEVAAITHPACGKLDLARFGELAGIAQ